MLVIGRWRYSRIIPQHHFPHLHPIRPLHPKMISRVEVKSCSRRRFAILLSARFVSASKHDYGSG